MTFHRIDEIDKNLAVAISLSESDIRFYDVRKRPFEGYGLYNFKREPVFRRMPDPVAEAAGEKIRILNLDTAGGRVRFSTDSAYVSIQAVMPYVKVFPHMTLAGTSGFDLYIDENGKSAYYKTFVPPVGMQNGYESIHYFPDRRMRNITINFPLYNPVNALYIGLQKDAAVGKGARYAIPKPILYYGSSITQGGCASRPGNSYEAIISRRLNCDHINLGFSGNALAEDAVVDYMAGLQSSVFVCDYDHNAPDADYLEATHEKLYQKFRSGSPNVPIVFVTRPDFENGVSLNILRRDVIYATYIRALKNGDKNVYFIDGERLFQQNDRDCCTVDGCHPNDVGFLRMAETIGLVVETVLKKQMEGSLA